MKSNIKVICKSGKKSGKTIVLLASIHGNEKCGVIAFNKILKNIKIESGKVYFIYANLKAIRQNKRFIEKNLNRCFFIRQSKEIKLSFEGKTAREIIPYLNSADLMLDLHASPTKDAKPFVICDKKQIKYAYIFNSKIITYNWDPFEPGSTDYYMNQRDKSAFCFECGYAKNNESSKVAEKTIRNFLIFTKNIKGKLYTRKNQRILKITSIFINRKSSFKKRKYYKDFKKLNKKTLIGYEGKIPIFIKKNEIIFFLKNKKELNEECFLIAKENLNKQCCSIKSKENNSK